MATINRELAALKRLFSLARQSGKVTAVPYIAVHLVIAAGQERIAQRIELRSQIRKKSAQHPKPVTGMSRRLSWQHRYLLQWPRSLPTLCARRNARMSAPVVCAPTLFHEPAWCITKFDKGKSH